MRFRIVVSARDVGQGRWEAKLEHYHDLTSRFPETRNCFVAENLSALEILLERVREQYPEALWSRRLEMTAGSTD